MATTVGPSTGTPPPGPSDLPPPDIRSARAALKRHENPRARIVRLVILGIAVVVLVQGWLVTEIDLGKLGNATNAGPILGALLRPDVVARDLTDVQVTVPYTVGPGPAEPVTDATGRLTITPGSATAGDDVSFDGTGLAPDADGQLRLQDPTRGIDLLFTRVKTDGQGNFHEARPWPLASVVPLGEYTFRLNIKAPTGQPHFSETLMTSVVRMAETVLLALMGTFFGVLISIPLSFLGARNLMSGSVIGEAIYSVTRVLFTITRSIEVLILGVIMVVIVGIGSYAGVLALVIHSVGSLGKLYSEAIEGIETGPVEAITATGANRVQTILFGVIPQVVPAFLAVTIYWWDHNVRMSTVLGLVGGGGIGFLLIQYINLLQYSQAATVLWLIIIVVTIMDYASAAIRAKLV
jgi:phosphonate transport system permease protein